MAKPKNIKSEILKLRGLGQTYDQIVQALGCGKSTVCYHCGENQRDKTRTRAKQNKNTRLTKKISRFLHTSYIEKNKQDNKFGFDKCIYWKIKRFIRRVSMTDEIQTAKLLDKIKNNPRCYLTGKLINLEDTKSWHLDHIVPVSRGGSNDVDNCAILTKNVNFAKHNLTNEEFIQLCKDVLIHQGYTIKGLSVESAPT